MNHIENAFAKNVFQLGFVSVNWAGTIKFTSVLSVLFSVQRNKIIVGIVCNEPYLITNKIFLHNRLASNINPSLKFSQNHINSLTLTYKAILFRSNRFFRIMKMRLMMILLIQVSLAHDSHGLGDRKDFKYQDSWTVKILRHLTGNWFSIALKSLNKYGWYISNDLKFTVL